MIASLKKLPTIIFLFSCYLASAQSYIPLVVESATWVIYDNSLEFNNDYYAFRIEGDTIINTIEYKKVYLYDLEDHVPAPYRVLDKYLAGVLREDLVNKKVYGKLYAHPLSDAYETSCKDSTILVEEVLLINFDVSLGQNFEDCMVQSDIRSASIISDNYEFLFGRNRRVIENEFGNQLIEGIGYENGLFANLGFIHASKPYNLVSYCQDYLYNCNLLTASQDLNLEYKLSPNPTQSEVCIESTFPIKELRVYDMGGMIVSKQLGPDKCFSLDLESGLYIIHIIDKEDRRGINKLLIAK